MSIHNEAKKGEIAKIVLMPGDPLRAKMIAETYLEDYKLVNQVRNIFAYTGKYKGKEITVMASGMGMPSMGIYAYELYKFYDVETIIRIGSCGTYDENMELLDTVMVDECYNEGNFAKAYTGEECHWLRGNLELNEIMQKKAKELNIDCQSTNVLCTEVFDHYVVDIKEFMSRIPKDKNIRCAEMESFALFLVAKMLDRKAGCLLTVVDSVHKKDALTSEQREKALNNMIEIALESALEIG